nr:ABC transporter ATP-binding protein [Pseudomonas sp. efr-133-TYG-103a]
MQLACINELAEKIMNQMSSDTSAALFVLRGISQRYGEGKNAAGILHNIDLTLYRGDTCAIVGASGSGKSTLLNILGLLERPSSGELRFAGRDVTTASPNMLAHWRNRSIGFIFQSFNLLPRLSALDNVALPLAYRQQRRKSPRDLAMQQLRAVGLADCVHRRPAELSGGQRQRVAIARALIGEPTLILADEPTGNLDQQCANEIIELLLGLNIEHRVTLVVVTHDVSLAKRFARRIEVINGQLLERSDHAV